MAVNLTVETESEAALDSDGHGSGFGLTKTRRRQVTCTPSLCPHHRVEALLFNTPSFLTFLSLALPPLPHYSSSSSLPPSIHPLPLPLPLSLWQVHALRLLQVGAELVQEARGQLVVHQPPVAGQGDGHELLRVHAGARAVLGVGGQLQHGARAAHGQDAGLRRVDDGAEAADAKHAEIGDTDGGREREGV